MRIKIGRFFPSLILATLIAGPLPATQAATISLSAFAGDTGVDISVDGVFDSLLGGPFSLAVQALRDEPPLGIGGIDPSGEERRGILEYDLSSISGTVISATLNPDFLNFSNPQPDLDVFVYAADGIVTLSDMTTMGTLVFQAQISGTPSGPIDVTAALLDVLSGGATHLGVRIQVTGDPNFVTWANGNGRFSTLHIETIPLPPAIWLLGSSLLCLIAVARRNEPKTRTPGRDITAARATH